MNVLMPQLGETVTEGKITKWFKAAGDAVKPGDNLFEIETDKTSMEVPATSAKRLDVQEAAITYDARLRALATAGSTPQVAGARTAVFSPALAGALGAAAPGVGVQHRP